MCIKLVWWHTESKLPISGKFCRKIVGSIINEPIKLSETSDIAKRMLAAPTSAYHKSKTEQNIVSKSCKTYQKCTIYLYEARFVDRVSFRGPQLLQATQLLYFLFRSEPQNVALRDASLRPLFNRIPSKDGLFGLALVTFRMKLSCLFCNKFRNKIIIAHDDIA